MSLGAWLPRGAPCPLSCVPPQHLLCPGPLPCRCRMRGGVCPQPWMLCRVEDTQTGPRLPEKQRPWPLTPSLDYPSRPSPGLSSPHTSAPDNKTVPSPSPRLSPRCLCCLPAPPAPSPHRTDPRTLRLGPWGAAASPGLCVSTPTASGPADLAPDQVSSCPWHIPLDTPLLQHVPWQPSACPALCLGPGASGGSLFIHGPGWEAGVTGCLPL